MVWRCHAWRWSSLPPPHSPTTGSPAQRHITADVACDVAFFESHAPRSASPFFYVTSDTASAGRVVFETVTHMHPGARVVVTDSAANYSSPTSSVKSGPKDGFVHTLSTHNLNKLLGPVLDWYMIGKFDYVFACGE